MLIWGYVRIRIKKIAKSRLFQIRRNKDILATAALLTRAVDGGSELQVRISALDQGGRERRSVAQKKKEFTRVSNMAAWRVFDC